MQAQAPSSIRQLRRLLRGISVGMLTTHTDAAGGRSRPILMQGVDERGWMWFLTDRRSREATELIRNPQASVSFQSSRGDRFVSVHGTPVVVHDDVVVKHLRNPAFRAWFPKGRKEPSLSLVALEVSHADYWLVPHSRLTRAIGAARAVVTGKRSEAGHGQLSVLGNQ